jgi:hypothetical protein
MQDYPGDASLSSFSSFFREEKTPWEDAVNEWREGEEIFTIR